MILRCRNKLKKKQKKEEEEEEEEEERERKEEKIRTHEKNALFSPAGGFVDLSFRIFKIVAWFF